MKYPSAPVVILLASVLTCSSWACSPSKIVPQMRINRRPHGNFSFSLGSRTHYQIQYLINVVIYYEYSTTFEPSIAIKTDCSSGSDAKQINTPTRSKLDPRKLIGKSTFLKRHTIQTIACDMRTMCWTQFIHTQMRCPRGKSCGSGSGNRRLRTEGVHW